MPQNLKISDVKILGMISPSKYTEDLRFLSRNKSKKDVTSFDYKTPHCVQLVKLQTMFSELYKHCSLILSVRRDSKCSLVTASCTTYNL